MFRGQFAGRGVNGQFCELSHFLVHEFYFKCFGPSKKQAFIDSCNDVIAKYTTVENLIYNQIRLENLLKDYKWNNPDLNSIKNIELIYKLQQLIKTDGFTQ